MTCAGLCYLCLHPLKLPLAQARCPMPEWEDCIRRQRQLDADAWYAELLERMRERAPA